MELLKKICIYINAVLLIMIGVDKFFPFMEPCSLLGDVPGTAWYVIGVIELILGIGLFLGKFTQVTLFLVILVMGYAIVAHLMAGTYDLGGALFMLVVAAIALILDFILSKKTQVNE